MLALLSQWLGTGGLLYTIHRYLGLNAAPLDNSLGQKGMLIEKLTRRGHALRGRCRAICGGACVNFSWLKIQLKS